MVQVVDYEEFKAIEDRLRQAEKHIDFLIQLLLSQRWLNRAQTMQTLNVLGSTLHRLTRANKLTYRYEGVKPLYCVASLRAYMTSQCIEGRLIDQQLMMAGQTN